MICLGLDIGSSSIKGAVLDLEGGHISEPCKVPFPNPLEGLPPGHFEVSVTDVAARVEQLVTQLLQQAPTAEALLVSGQMGGVVLVDSDGQPLTNYFSWRDQRTLKASPRATSYLEEIRALWESALPQLGRELQPGSASSLLYWLAQQNQLPDGVVPATIADAVLGKLCQTTPQMDPTHAIGLLDLRVGTWHHPAFARLGIDRVNWPNLADQMTPVGEWTISGVKLRCHASFGDQQCALRGVGLTTDDLSINVSTGSQVSRCTETFVSGPYQSRCFFQGRYLNTITHLPAGRSLNVLVDLLTEVARAEGLSPARVWSTIAEKSELANGNGLQADLSFFAGPFGSEGSLRGITTENLNVGNLFFAAFQNMADNYAQCAQRLLDSNPQTPGSAATHAPRGIVLSGGLTHTVPVLRRLIQERFSIPIRESTEVEETLAGLLALGRDIYGK